MRKKMQEKNTFFFFFIKFNTTHIVSCEATFHQFYLSDITNEEK